MRVTAERDVSREGSGVIVSIVLWQQYELSGDDYQHDAPASELQGSLSDLDPLIAGLLFHHPLSDGSLRQPDPQFLPGR
jgi:hypothetical protein